MKKILVLIVGITVSGGFLAAFFYLIGQWPKAPHQIPVKEILLLPDRGEALKTEANQKRWRLYEAVKEGPDSAVFNLLREGVNVNIKDKTFGWTPLHWAVANQKQSLIFALLENGAEVNARDNNLWTPLHEAVSNSDLKTAFLLLQKSTDVNTEDINIWTPLHEAVANNDLKIARLLLEQGADVNKKDMNHWSPLEIAKKEGNREALNLLSKYNIAFKLKGLIFLFLLLITGILLIRPAEDSKS